jgi:hypothetical protein
VSILVAQSSTLGGQKLADVPVRRALVPAFMRVMEAVAPDKAKIDEAAAVTRWRLHELLRAGYSWDQGVLLAARSDVDLHQAVDLLRRGCPTQTALQILL